MLRTLVYVSSATQPFSPDDLAALLQISRRNNAKRGITGLLLHVGGNFMQTLEGEDDAVDDLYQKIVRDQRHGLIKALLRLPIEHRVFPDWAMGFREGCSLPESMRREISSFLDDASRHDDGAAIDGHDHPALRLMRTFAVTMR